MCCYALNALTLPPLLNSIGMDAFCGCSSLREIAVPGTVGALPESCFSGCSSLQTATIGEGISGLGKCAFVGCTNLRSIALPEGLTTIDESCFGSCDALRSMTLPSTVKYLGKTIWGYCDGLTSVTVQSNFPPSSGTGTSGAFYDIPNAFTVFVPCESMEDYTADNYWKTLPLAGSAEWVLRVATSDERMGEALILKHPTCTDSSATLQAAPATGCQFVAWSDGNTDNPREIQLTADTLFTAVFNPIATYTLRANYDCEMGYVDGAGEYYVGTEATLTATALPGHRFLQWSDGVSTNPRKVIVTQDSTLTAEFIYGDYCGNKILWTLEEGVLALNGQGEMYNQSEFGWYQQAEAVETITLSDNITSIGTNAFMDLLFVPEVTIPATVQTIHKRAFENCRSLDSIIFAANSQLTTIDAWAFFQCINLQSLTIPEGVTTIGNDAFYGCAYLKNLVLASTLEDISDNGFALCAQLRQMTVNAVEPPAVDSKTFENVNRAIPVHVPNGSGKKYRAAAVWQEFNIVDESEPTGMEQTDAAVAAPRKVVRDGQVLIIRGDEVYTVLGETIQ